MMDLSDAAIEQVALDYAATWYASDDTSKGIRALGFAIAALARQIRDAQAARIAALEPIPQTAEEWSAWAKAQWETWCDLDANGQAVDDYGDHIGLRIAVVIGEKDRRIAALEDMLQRALAAEDPDEWARDALKLLALPPSGPSA